MAPPIFVPRLEIPGKVVTSYYYPLPTHPWKVVLRPKLPKIQGKKASPRKKIFGPPILKSYLPPCFLFGIRYKTLTVEYLKGNPWLRCWLTKNERRKSCNILQEYHLNGLDASCLRMPKFWTPSCCISRRYSTVIGIFKKSRIQREYWCKDSTIFSLSS